MQRVVANGQFVVDAELVDVHIAIVLTEGEREGAGGIAAVFECESDVGLAVLGAQLCAGGRAEEFDEGGRQPGVRGPRCGVR